MGHNIRPLSDFSEREQCEIAEAVAQPKPPPKWKFFGPEDSYKPLAAIVSRAWYEWNLARGRRFDGGGMVRRGISEDLRAEIILRDGLICRLCGDMVESIRAIDIDHIIPVARGGETTRENLQVTHASCNRRKGARVDG